MKYWKALAGFARILFHTAAELSFNRRQILKSDSAAGYTTYLMQITLFFISGNTHNNGEVVFHTILKQKSLLCC